MNVLIVEDEKKTALLLKELIEHNQNYLVTHICDSVDDTIKYLEKHQQHIDLLFLDVQLADGESFEIFEEIEVHKPVIFCTAYDQYVLKAFKNNGIDYILKPFKESDIQHALEKIETLKSSFKEIQSFDIKSIQSLIQEEKTVIKKILVRKAEKVIPIDISDIAFFNLSHEQLELFTFQNEKFIVTKTMDEIEKSVPISQFFRINRQMMVNRDAVEELEPFFNRKMIVKLTVEIPKKAVISRLKVSPFLKWIEG